MTKAGRIDPLVHYSRKVRGLEAEIEALRSEASYHRVEVARLRQVVADLTGEQVLLEESVKTWRKIADGFAEAGTHPTAHDLAMEDYEEAVRGG